MNSFVESEINNMEKRMAGYQYLLNYRYQNLCVKAEPSAFLPVTVNATGTDQNIEDVADVMNLDDFHIAILPKMTNCLNEIHQGVLNAHPEFLMSIGQTDKNDPDTQYLVYEMPKVNKDRYEFLTEAVKSLHDECQLRLDEAQGEEKAGFADLLVNNPDELKPANDEIDKLHKTYSENIQELLEKKNQEIEEAYQRWQSEEAALSNYKPDDVTHRMKMGELED